MRKTLLALGLSLALPFGLVSPALADLTPPKIEVNAGYAEDLMDFGGTIVVPTVYVKFLVDGKVFVSKQGSALSTLGGGSANSVKASAKYKVAGLDKQLAQSIAKQAYDDFVKRMRDAGYTVLTYDDVKDRELIKDIERDTGVDKEWGLPVESPMNTSDKYLIATPSDAQQFKIPFTGVLAPFMKRGKSRLDDATVVIPQYTIVAPQVWGEGKREGYNRISAEISTAPGMNLNYATVQWLGKPHVRMGGKAMGVTTKNYVANITEKAGEMVKTEDTTPQVANGLSKALSMFAGGQIQSNSANYTFTVDPAAYTAGALNGIGAFNAEAAKFAATAKK